MLLLLLSLLLAEPQRGPRPRAAAPPATPSSYFDWDQGAPDAATAQGYVYRYYADGDTAGKTFPTSITCAMGAAPTPGIYTCTVAIPAFAPGSHTVVITAAIPPNGMPSAQSNSVTFTFNVAPSVPANLRLR